MRQMEREKLLQSKYANLQEEVNTLDEVRTHANQ